MMKLLRTLFVGALLLVGATASAAVVPEFNQDHMITTNYSIIVHSPLDRDHITSYSDYGTFQWDVTMDTKVVSMRMKDGLLYILSQTRSSFNSKTYLTCVDPISGLILWERP
ncbi:MAG: hypothetical protein ACHQUC_10465 [Chlamydiales bacterium]